MKKFIVVLLALTTLSISIFASQSTDTKIKEFVEYLKKGKYDIGIVKLLSGSALEEKVLNVTQTKTNWINQFNQIRSLYGNYLNLEKVKTIKLGELEKTIYFVYCEIYPIQIIIIEYNNGEKIDIINMEFDDQVLNTLSSYGKIN